MAEKEKNNELENMSFEDAINELEKIVDELEGNEISLDEAVNAYERGSKLKNICQERLNEAKMKENVSEEIVKDWDVQSFPTILVVDEHYKKVAVYDGDRSVSAFEAFANSR